MIVALDLGTNIGMCWGDGGELPRLGHHRLPSTGEDVGPFADAYERWLRFQIEQIEPTLLLFEAPILPAQTQIMTVRKLQGLAWSTELIAYREGIECREIHLQEAKKALTGRGNAKK